MIRSMTGFGRSRMTVDGLDVTVEIRSVNSRFLDCNTKISRAYGYLEDRIKPYLSSRGVTRGKVDVWISIEMLDSGNVEIVLDEGYLRGYLRASRRYFGDERGGKPRPLPCEEARGGRGERLGMREAGA